VPDKFVQLLDCKAVLQMTGLGRSTFFELRGAGKFPRPLHWSTNKYHVAWRVEDVQRWLADRDGGIASTLNPFMRNKSATDISPVVREWTDT
jgi:predicted DNA-binding transcriptional regulator AlpA